MEVDASMSARSSRWLLLLIVAIAGASCMTRPFTVTVKNETGTELDDVTLVYDRDEFFVGVLIPESAKTWTGPNEVAVHGELTWRTLDGRRYAMPFDIAKQLPADLDSDSELIFEIGPDAKVKVVARPRVRLKPKT